MPSTPAAPPFLFTFNHASHTNHLEMSCALPCNLGSLMRFLPSRLITLIRLDNPPRLHPHCDTQGIHSYYRRVRQRACNGTQLSSLRILPLEVLPLATSSSQRLYQATPSHVPYESPDRTHAACTPDTAWAVNG